MNGRDVVLRSKIEIATWVLSRCPVNDATLQRMIRINDELVDLYNWLKGAIWKLLQDRLWIV